MRSDKQMTFDDTVQSTTPRARTFRALPERLRLAYGLIPIVGLLEASGIDAGPVLALAGVPWFGLSDPRYTIDFEQEITVLREAARVMPYRHASIDLARRHDLRSFSVLGAAMSACTTLADAVALMGRYPRLAWGGAPFESRWDGSRLRMLLLHEPTLGTVEPFIHERDVAAFLHLMRELSGRDVRYSEVRFIGAAPPDLEPYRAFFKSPVTFGAPRTECVLAAEVGRLPLPHPDARTQRFYESQCAAMSDAMDRPFRLVDSVRERLHWAPVLPGLAATAADLRMEPRTLQRRLRREGSNFAAVLHDVRIARAKQLLATGTPLADIAEACGFSDQTALSRAFRSWTGQPLSAWRRRHTSSS